MIDAHCHLDDERLEAVGGAHAVIERARAVGVVTCVVAGAEPEGWASQSALASAEPGLVVTYGVHPWVAAAATDDGLDRLIDALDEALRGGPLVRPVGLGETGLDRSRFVASDSLPRQERAFRAQLELARRYDLPLVLHLLQAHGPAMLALRAVGLPDAGGMVHSFSGSAEVARAYVALGLHVSFAGTICHDNARRLREAARVVPLDRLLVETDAPDQTPPARRPGVNEPGFLPDVIGAVALARGITPEAVAEHTAANARRLFALS